MTQSSFRYETSQRLPATLTHEEREALRRATHGMGAVVARALARLSTALSRGAEARRA